jgi:hypothetical protein
MVEGGTHCMLCKKWEKWHSTVEGGDLKIERDWDRIREKRVSPHLKSSPRPFSPFTATTSLFQFTNHTDYSECLKQAVTAEQRQPCYTLRYLNVFFEVRTHLGLNVFSVSASKQTRKYQTVFFTQASVKEKGKDDWVKMADINEDSAHNKITRSSGKN